LLAVMTATDLRKRRDLLGMTQAQMAEQLSVDVMTISRWERGVRDIPPHLHLAIDHLECIRGGTPRRRKN